MADRGHGIGGKRPGGSPDESGDAAPEPGERPGAAGHRFGPRLVCSECGIRWDVHQRDRKPCVASAPAGRGGDPFARRPVLPVVPAANASPLPVRIDAAPPIDPAPRIDPAAPPVPPLAAAPRVPRAPDDGST